MLQVLLVQRETNIGRFEKIMSCERNTGDMTATQINSENEMKKRLIKTGISIKVECTHVDITTACSTVEDSGMFELFEPDIDKVKCPLENPETFECSYQSLTITRESIPMIDMSSITNDESMTPSDTTSFLSTFSSLLKLPANDEQHATKSHFKSVTSPLIHEFAENSRVHSSERLIKLNQIR